MRSNEPTANINIYIVVKDEKVLDEFRTLELAVEAAIAIVESSGGEVRVAQTVREFWVTAKSRTVGWYGKNLGEENV